MAYMSQDRKAKIAPVVRAICKKYGIKASLAVRHHSTLVLNVQQGSIDFIGNYNETVDARPGGFRNGSPAEKSIQVNPYWYHEHFSGRAKQFLAEVLAAMNTGNHDRSEIQYDYHDVGWYVDVNIGRWDQPYALVR
jgi:hypothetical protein